MWGTFEMQFRRPWDLIKARSRTAAILRAIHGGCDDLRSSAQISEAAA